MSDSEKPKKKLSGWGKPGENLKPVESHWLAGLVKEEHWLKGLVSEDQSADSEDEAASSEPPLIEESNWEIKAVATTHWLTGVAKDDPLFKGLLSDDGPVSEGNPTSPESTVESDPELTERPEETTVPLDQISYEELARAEAISKRSPVPEPEPEPKPTSQPTKREPDREPSSEDSQDLPLKKAPEKAAEPEPEKESIFSSRPVESSKLVRQRALVYRALSVMMDAGIAIYGAFEFLAVQCESPALSQACRRTAQELAQGKSLAKIALKEPILFQESAAMMLEVGMRSGKLVAVLKKLADDEEARWGFRSRLTNQLIYPILLAVLALLAAIILPPLALTSLLEQVLKFTDEPPVLTLIILKISSVLSSPEVLTAIALSVLVFFFSLRLRVVQERLKEMEPWVWMLPGLGPFVRVVLSIRFFQLFSMMYEVGMPAMQCLSLASKSTGSVVVGRLSQTMRSTLMAGGTLRESLEAGDFLPRLCLEAVETGEQTGKIPAMMRSASTLLGAELEYRVEGLLALLEPILLTFLGVCVGVFALGCLLPILKLVETL